MSSLLKNLTESYLATCAIAMVGFFALSCVLSEKIRSAPPATPRVLEVLPATAPIFQMDCGFCVGTQNLRRGFPQDMGGLSTGTDGDPYTIPCGYEGYVMWSVDYLADPNQDGFPDCCWDGTVYGVGLEGVPAGCAAFYLVVNPFPHKIGDGDADGDIDSVDQDIFRWCELQVPAHPQWECCLCNFDFDEDGDLDADDGNVLAGDLGLTVYGIIIDQWGAP